MTPSTPSSPAADQQVTDWARVVSANGTHRLTLFPHSLGERRLAQLAAATVIDRFNTIDSQTPNHIGNLDFDRSIRTDLETDADASHIPELFSRWNLKFHF